MKRRPRSDRSKDTWYELFEPANRAPVRCRSTETFRNEQDAKEFAKVRLIDSSNVAAGTLNPHVPKLTIPSAQLFDWLNAPDGW